LIYRRKVLTRELSDSGIWPQYKPAAWKASGL
jgi:hypothetical protein